MPDQRPGRGPNQMPTSVRRRPAFQTPAGESYEASTAAQAAMASGDVRGDLRGPPPRGLQNGTLVGERRRRAAAAEPMATDLPTDGDRETSRKASNRAERQPRRDERAMEDRQFSEDRELTDDERVAMVRQGFFQVALPDLPKKPGLHRMWLTTTNSRDPIAARIRAGYRLLKYEDLGPGWLQSKATTGEYAGCIVINEMVAAEIDEALFQRFMRVLHHDLPREQEQGIYGRLEAVGDDLKRRGSRLVMDDADHNTESGYESLRTYTPPPRQFES